MRSPYRPHYASCPSAWLSVCYIRALNLRNTSTVQSPCFVLGIVRETTLTAKKVQQVLQLCPQTPPGIFPLTTTWHFLKRASACTGRRVCCRISTAASSGPTFLRVADSCIRWPSVGVGIPTRSHCWSPSRVFWAAYSPRRLIRPDVYRV